MPRYAELIYNGFWWSARSAKCCRPLIDYSQAKVNGQCPSQAVQGQRHPGRRVDRVRRLASTAMEHVTFEDDAVYDQRDAEGFIKLNALRLKLLNRQGH